MDLKGRRAIITGSNSGIGLGVARALARAGADVVLNSFTDRDEDHALAEQVAAEFGVGARYLAADMADGAACRALVAEAGGCDILVNNAGIQHVAPIEAFPVAKWEAILAINLTSAFHTSAAALPGMRAKGWGRIVNIASAHGMERETVIREVMLARQPSRQFATVDEIGGTTVFLCSAAAAQITGTTISVDGGWTAL